MDEKYKMTDDGYVVEVETGEVLYDDSGDPISAPAIMMVHLMTGGPIEDIINSVRA